MVTCPNGHTNPAGWEFCGDCGAPIEAAAEEVEARAWHRTKWAIVGAGVLAVLVISGAAVALILTVGGKQTSSSTPTSVGSAAIQEWWSGAHEHFTELQNALDDAQRALDRLDGTGFEAACQQMHDAGEVGLQAHLPAPDPDLTSELRAAIEDAHAAAHLCLSVVAGSMTNYDGEFIANIDQADKHMQAAQDMINKSLARTA
jgi:hypothetical protein